ncbi:MAG: hypothetical protein KBT58_02110 [Bizionia sp.]|nr:hypothetical protein [Bizionia sp.]
MKKIQLVFICIIIFSCASHTSKTSKKNYEIGQHTTLRLNETDTIKVNKLGFTPKYSATDLQKYLFNTYGKWTNTIESDKDYPYLIWENLKLLKNSDQLFTVAASGEDYEFKTVKINGVQKYSRILYCSALVFNAQGVDCLQESSKIKDELAQYFISGVKSVKKKNTLFEKEISTH